MLDKVNISKNNKILLSTVLSILYVWLGTIQLNIPSQLSQTVETLGLLTGMQLSVVTFMSVGIGPILIAGLAMKVICKVSPFFSKLYVSSNGKHHYLKILKLVISILYCVLQIIVLIGYNQLFTPVSVFLLIGTILAYVISYTIEKIGWGFGISTIIGANLIAVFVGIVQAGLSDGLVIESIYYALSTLIGVVVWVYMFNATCHLYIDAKLEMGNKKLDICLSMFPPFLYPVLILSILLIYSEIQPYTLVLLIGTLLIGLFKFAKYFSWNKYEKLFSAKEIVLTNPIQSKTMITKLLTKSSIYFLCMQLLCYALIDYHVVLPESTMIQSTILVMFLASTISGVYSFIKSDTKVKGN